MWQRILAVLFVLFLFVVTESCCKTTGYYTEEEDGSGSGHGEKRDFNTWLKLQEDDEDSSSGCEDCDSDQEASGEPEVVCENMVDISLILDGSESVGPIGFRKIKAYAKEILNEFDLSHCDNVGIIKFTEFANSETYLGTRDTKANIFDRIDSLDEPKKLNPSEVNKSKIALALLVAEELVFTTQLGLRPDSKKYLVVMTDGKQPKHDISNRSLTIERLVKKLSDKDVRILVLAIGVHPDIGELTRLTKSGRYVFPERRLGELMNILVPKIKHPNLLNDMGDFFVTEEAKSSDNGNNLIYYN